jgi:endoglycosylceramidase
MQREFHTQDGRIVDVHGRTRIFHGASVSGRAKTPPFLGLDDPALLDALCAWKWNLVRLLVQWEAIEPEPGKYDDEHLGRVMDLAFACHARGLFTIIDFHQDLFARHYGGDGAPAWALPIQPGEPRFRGRRWFQNYFFCRDLVRAEEAFWRNAHGLQDRYHEMLTHVARRFATVPGILGYDVMNEPMGRPREVLNGRFERETLALFYRRAIGAVRQGDPSRVIVVEPAPLVGLGRACSLPALRENEIIFGPHLYDALAIATGKYRPLLSPLGRTMSGLDRAGRRLGMPVLVGEFGVLNDHAAGEAMLERIAGELDARFFSWAAWHYNPSDVDWNEEDASLVTPDGRERGFLQPLVRPYARAVAGRPVLCRWLARAHRFEFHYEPDASCTAPTEIAIPSRCFHVGASVVVEGARWRRDSVTGEIAFIDPDASASRVRVVISG